MDSQTTDPESPRPDIGGIILRSLLYLIMVSSGLAIFSGLTRQYQSGEELARILNAISSGSSLICFTVSLVGIALLRRFDR